jgi:hypothetical protein
MKRGREDSDLRWKFNPSAFPGRKEKEKVKEMRTELNRTEERSHICYAYHRREIIQL